VGRRSRPNLHNHSPLRARRSHHSPDDLPSEPLCPGRRIAVGRTSEAVKSGAGGTRVGSNVGGIERETCQYETSASRPAIVPNGEGCRKFLGPEEAVRRRQSAEPAEKKGRVGEA